MLAHAPIKDAKPVLKWAGGKRQLLTQYAPYFPELGSYGRYFEPFIGSAAVFFHLQPSVATLSDRNQQLIEVYQVIRNDVDGLIDALQGHLNESDYYYAVRAQNVETLTAVQRVARFIYLNKTCYNGLYRENKKGKFNVPFGRYVNPKICDENRLRAVSEMLQSIDILAIDFEDAVATAQQGDFVYLDPPYAPLNKTSNFTSYDRYGFYDEDQERLAETIHDLTERGVHVMLSNSTADIIYELYDLPQYLLIPIQARRNINSKAAKRGLISELLILNY
ncbi:MAG: DNA adenine methylase [Chloroflexota bacterium]